MLLLAYPRRTIFSLIRIIHGLARHCLGGDGTFTVIMDSLDQPTSLEFIGNSAYVVTLTGEIWKIDGVSCPPNGVSR